MRPLKLVLCVPVKRAETIWVITSPQSPAISRQQVERETKTVVSIGTEIYVSVTNQPVSRVNRILRNETQVLLTGWFLNIRGKFQHNFNEILLLNQSLSLFYNENELSDCLKRSYVWLATSKLFLNIYFFLGSIT